MDGDLDSDLDCSLKGDFCCQDDEKGMRQCSIITQLKFEHFHTEGDFDGN